MTNPQDILSGLLSDDTEGAMADQRKQAIAMLLLKQLQQNRPTQQAPVGGYNAPGIVAKTPLSALLMNAGAQGIAQSDIASADAAMAARRQRAQQDYLSGMQGFADAPDKDAAIAKLMTSQNPMLRQMAEAQAKIRREQAEKEAERNRQLREAAARAFVEKGDTQGALQVLAEGAKVDPTRVPPPAPAPVFGSAPGPDGKPIPTVTNVDPKSGKTSASFGPGPASRVDVNLPGKEGEMRLKNEQEDLVAQQTAARSGVENLALTQRMRNLLRDGAVSGGGESLMQTARKVGELFGIKVPATGFTDELRSTLGERVLDKSKSLGSQPTNEDRRIIQEIMGSIDTDPKALIRLAAILDAQSLKANLDFKDFLGVKRKGANPSLYETADIGINAQPVSGPVAYRLQVAQGLLQRGVAPARVSQMTGIAEENLPPPDAAVAISTGSYLGPGAGKLAAPQPTAKPTKPLDQMTDAELAARLEALRKGK